MMTTLLVSVVVGVLVGGTPQNDSRSEGNVPPSRLIQASPLAQSPLLRSLV